MNFSKLLLPAPACFMILLISSASAAPVMSLSSFANYHLTASTFNTQDCTSGNVTIAAVICSNPSSVPVNINGDGICNVNDTRCSFSPGSVTISAGMSVTWHDLDINYHNLFSNATLDGLLPSFSIYVYQGSSSSQQFFTPGTYHYYDNQHTWMKGIVIVTPAVQPPPIITSFGADGSMGWNVAGLDQANVLLGVNHRISVYNQTATPPRPVYNDSGTLEQYVDLSTRAESPTSLVLLQSLPFGLSFTGFYGYGYGGYGYPPPFIYPGSFYNFQPAKTLWWVNGPLDNGSIVELLSGYASVTGATSIQLPSALGRQDAWSVSMVYSEATNQTEPAPSNGYYFYCPGIFFYGGPQPQPQCFISMSTVSITLTADYSQHSDLLLDLTATVSTLTQTTTNYPAGSTVYNSINGYGYGYGITVTSPVSLVRTSTSRVTFSLGLSNANLDMSKRMALQASQSGGTTTTSPSPTSNQPIPMTMTIEYFLAGIGVTALASTALWAAIRSRRRPTLSSIPQPPVTTP